MTALFARHPGEADLALFAGGELGPVSRWRIESHLSGCTQCRQAVSEFFELRSGVMDLAELPALDWSGMAARIERRVEQERAAPRRMALWRPAWGAAVALAALVVAGAYVARQAGPSPVSMDASALAVSLRMGNNQVLTLESPAQSGAQVTWRVSADAVSARYVDPDTGNITVNNVYSQ